MDIFPELREKDTQSYIAGSARIALEVAPPFKRYIYIDLDPNNCARLNNLSREYPSKSQSIEIVNAEANAYIQNLVRSTDWRTKRAVLFLDPFGMEVEWPTVSAIAGSGAIDLWYLFPISAVNRMLPRSGQPPEKWKKRLDLLFGSSSWRERFYAVSRDADLFGESGRSTKVAAPWSGITEYIVERLEQEFPEVARNPRILRNPRTNTPLYLMCFAAASPGRGGQLAVKIAQDILNRMSK